MRKNLDINDEVLDWLKVNYPGLSLSYTINYILFEFIQLHPKESMFRTTMEKAIATFYLEKHRG